MWMFGLFRIFEGGKCVWCVRCLKTENFYLRFLILEAKKDALSIAHLLANTHSALELETLESHL